MPRSPIRIDITTFRAEDNQAVMSYKTDKISHQAASNIMHKSDKISHQTVTNSQKSYRISHQTAMDSPKIDKVSHQTALDIPKIDKISRHTTMDSPKVDKISHHTTMDSPKVDKISHHTTMDSPKIHKISHQTTMDSPKIDKISHETAMTSPKIDKVSHQTAMDIPKIDKISHHTTMDSPKVDKISHQTTMNSSKLEKIVCPFCLNSKNDSDNKNKCPCCLQTIVKKNTVSEQRKIKTAAVQTSEEELAKGFHLLYEILTEFQNKRCKPYVKDASVSTDDEQQKNNLLNEVLTEFQNKKSKKTSVKDACVLTEFKKPELCFSKVFVYTVEGDLGLNNFTVICNSKDNIQKEPLNDVNSVNLIKHKSTSIPRMKLDELKHLVKEKCPSRDTIEEVNRMFGNFMKNREVQVENRPLIRHGARMLPVVLTDAEKCRFDEQKSCKCCQSIHCMSSGDSLEKRIDTEFQNARCDKCVYLLCCHYKNTNKVQSLICEECQNKNLFG